MVKEGTIIEEGEPQPASPQMYESYMSGFYNQAKSDLIRWQLDAKDIIEQLEHDLKGEVWVGTDDEGKDIYEKKGKQMINQEGVSAIISLVSPRISKVIIMSNLEAEDVREEMLAFSRALTDLLYTQREKYEIERAYLSPIKYTVQIVVLAAMKRALRGGERDFLKTTERRIESYSDKEPSKKESLISAFKRI